MPLLKKTDVKKELDGVWHVLCGVRTRVAKLRNPRYTATMRGKLLELRARLGDAEPTPEQIELVHRRVLAETVLLEWQDLELVEGVKTPYSPENAFEILSDPGYREYYEAVLMAAADAAAYEVQQQEKDAGNSSRPSTGRSTGRRTKSG